MPSSHTHPLFFSLLISATILCTSLCAYGQEQGNSDKKNGKSDAKKDESLEVAFIGPSLPASDKDSADVLAALQRLLSGLGQRRIDQIAACLSQDVTMFDESNGKVISGKEAVLVHVKSKVIGRESLSPVKSIAVYEPFVRIKGETAMVSFRATKTMDNGQQLESWCSEVYERKDGQWLILQFRTSWKPTRSVD
jgi:hypothetical protein